MECLRVTQIALFLGFVNPLDSNTILYKIYANCAKFAAVSRFTTRSSSNLKFKLYFPKGVSQFDNFSSSLNMKVIVPARQRNVIYTTIN